MTCICFKCNPHQGRRFVYNHNMKAEITHIINTHPVDNDKLIQQVTHRLTHRNLSPLRLLLYSVLGVRNITNRGQVMYTLTNKGDLYQGMKLLHRGVTDFSLCGSYLYFVAHDRLLLLNTQTHEMIKLKSDLPFIPQRVEAMEEDYYSHVVVVRG